MSPNKNDPRSLFPLSWAGLAIVSAVVVAVATPSPDPLILLVLWLPTWLACCGLLLLVGPLLRPRDK
jgi:hypothetical protein